MKILKRLATAGLLLSGLWLAAPASAASLVFTFQGTVTSFVDVDNVYGFGAGANLTGDPVTDVYTLDTSTLAYTTGTIAGDPGSVWEAYGEGGISGLSSATSTIDGHTVTIGSGAIVGYLSQVYAPNPYNQAILELEAIGFETTGTDIGSEFLIRDEVVSYSTTGLPLSIVSPGGGYTLSPAALNAAGGNWGYQGVYFPYAAGATPGFFGPIPVPEPDAWALMLVGFGGLGAMMRWRRKLAAPVAA